MRAKWLIVRVQTPCVWNIRRRRPLCASVAMRINKIAAGTEFIAAGAPRAAAQRTRTKKPPEAPTAAQGRVRAVRHALRQGLACVQGGWRPRAKASIHMPSAEDRPPRRRRLSFGYFSLAKQRKVT